MWDLGENYLWWEKTDEDKRKIVILDIWLSSWIFAEKAPAITAHFANEPAIMLVSIADFRWKTRDEVEELIWWWEFREVWFSPRIEEERGIVISRMMEITDELFVEKVAWIRWWHVWFPNPQDMVNQMQEIAAFEIKSRKDLEMPYDIFEREIKSTKSFIKEMNKRYAIKKWRR